MTQQNVCNAFQRNDYGIWTATSAVTIPGPGGGSIQINPGMTFRRGVQFMGIDVAAWLEANCS